MALTATSLRTAAHTATAHVARSRLGSTWKSRPTLSPWCHTGFLRGQERIRADLFWPRVLPPRPRTPPTPGQHGPCRSALPTVPLSSRVTSSARRYDAVAPLQPAPRQRARTPSAVRCRPTSTAQCRQRQACDHPAEQAESASVRCAAATRQQRQAWQGSRSSPISKRYTTLRDATAVGTLLLCQSPKAPPLTRITMPRPMRTMGKRMSSQRSSTSAIGGRVATNFARATRTATNARKITQ